MNEYRVFRVLKIPSYHRIEAENEKEAIDKAIQEDLWMDQDSCQEEWVAESW